MRRLFLVQKKERKSKKDLPAEDETSFGVATTSPHFFR